MANIYNFLKNVLLDIKSQTNNNILFLWSLLLLVTIPLPFAVNNVVLAVFLLISILKFKKENVSFNLFLIVPIVLFFWMALSYFWSIDQETTLKAIPKEIGEELMLQALDTTRNARPKQMEEKMEISDKKIE